MDLESLNPDTVEEVFERHGAQSITLTDAADDAVLEPGPGQTPLWRDTRISGLFAADVNFERLADDLRQTLQVDSLPVHAVCDVEDRAWARECLKDVAAMCFGDRLWICPGNTTIDDDDAVIVRLDPGLAFGTGTHATTALCLEWLDRQSLQGKTLLDYGCGSGVLAIAALKLGCRRATAFDIDPQAITATQDNARRNDVSGHLHVVSSADCVTGNFDVVVANILAGPLVELAEGIVRHVKTGKSLALSGILFGQVGDVLAAYSPWIEFDEPALRDHGGQTWVRLTGRRNEG